MRARTAVLPINMRRLRFGRLGLRLAWDQGLSLLSSVTGRLLHKPLKATFEINTICNLRCSHCDTWQGLCHPDALKTDDWIALLRQLRGWCGPFSLSFAAGEPFLEPALLPIIREAARLGVRTTCVTNGTLLDRRAVQKICASGLSVLCLSLDGIRERTHDLGRRVPGTHAKALKALRLLGSSAARPVIRLNTIVAGHNLGELEALVRWAGDQEISGINFQPLMRCGGDWGSLWPDPAQAAETLDRLLALKEEGLPVLNPAAQLLAMKRYFSDPGSIYPGFQCGAYTGLYIGADGTVFLCTHKQPVGHALRQSLEDIWRTACVRERLGEITECGEPCILLNCHFRPSLRTLAAELRRR